jgi:hypothetical protein
MHQQHDPFGSPALDGSRIASATHGRHTSVSSSISATATTGGGGGASISPKRSSRIFGDDSKDKDGSHDTKDSKGKDHKKDGSRDGKE